MIKSHSVLKSLLIQLLFLISPAILFAGEISYSNRLQGSTGNSSAGYSAIANGNSFTVQDPEFPVTAGATFTDIDLENRVTLRYTGAALANSKYSVAWNYTVNYNIDFYTTSTTYTTQSGTLTISYDPQTSFSDIATIRYPASAGAYKIKVSVTGVSATVPGEDFTLEGEIYSNRTYKINLSSYPKDIRARLPYPASAAEPITIDPQINNEVEFNWDYFAGAEAYELEWSYVYAEAPGFAFPVGFVYPSDFSNATHVIVSSNSYKVTLAYEEGYIFYRVRPLTRHYLATEKWIAGAYYDFEEDYFKLSKSHDNTKNWVFGAVYAEDGMKKEVITYYDGTLRQRQSVTKNNSDNKAIVQSTYYDYEGRPAVNTLPEPNRFSGELKFYANYNLNTYTDPFTQISIDVPFSKASFDNQNTVNNPAAITTGDGGTYYSAANTQMSTDGFSSYIPEASGYAYVRTLYGIDGLVRKQSGAGPAHKISSGHETESYVATPLQTKLDLLFGMEAGESKYYREYAVKDANGQLAISYENLRGQVVATALAGEAPSNMTPLASAANPHDVNANLNSSNYFNEAQQAWLNHVELFVPSPGWYRFNYTLNSSWYTSLCEGGNYDCKYKFNMSIFDACNAPVDDDPSYSNSSNILFQTQTYTFTSNVTSVNTGYFWVNFLATGTYIIEKKLMLDEVAIEAEIAAYRSRITYGPNNPNYNTAQTCVNITADGMVYDFTAATDLSECTGCTTCVNTPDI
ncbi:MAG: hypothetical protein M3R17_11590, partial [Bacteroidota bacterium]|nr:hypothetical protein [Bacteroidota bacterium]